MNKIFIRPDKSEYSEYYENYIKYVGDGNVLELMEKQISELEKFINFLPKEKHNYRYKEGKWSIKELLGHLNDAERVYGYRALRYIRNDKAKPLGYEQDDYVKNARFEEWSIEDLIKEFVHLRRANLIMFNNVNEEESLREGTTSENARSSVRALPFIMIGHVEHHIKILKEKYL